MPRSNPTPPSFNDVSRVSDSLSHTQRAALEGTTAAQSIIFESAWATVFGFSLLLSLLLAVGIIYSMIRTRQIRKAERERFAREPLSAVARRVFGVEDAHAGSAHTLRWREVVEHANSENPNDWRQAILEADVMLDDAITNRGYTGDGLGEKMKQVERGDINSIDDAWEAHKVRNRIAHEGSSYELTQRETRRTISLYEKVLRELGHI